MSTRPSSIRSFFELSSLLAIVLAAVGLSHVVMDAVSRHAERDLGAYLWWQEELLQLLNPANYEGRGEGRLMVYGASEAREGILDGPIAARLPGVEVYLHSQSIGTLEDGLVVLDYIEKTYGEDAVPDELLLALTPRLMTRIREKPSPLFFAIDYYSPYWSVDGDPAGLVAKSKLRGLWSRVRFLRRQQRRYSGALLAVASSWLTLHWPESELARRAALPLKPAVYGHRDPWPRERVRKQLETEDTWAEVHAWDARKERDRMAEELGMLRAFARRHEMPIYLVEMPEHSWNRERFDSERYAAYLEQTRAGLPGAPLLDLRTLLSDDEYYDDCHPSGSGALRVSERIGDFVLANRAAARRALEAW